MKISFVMYAALALSLLVVSVAVGNLQNQVVPSAKSVRTEAHAFERKRLERLRGAVGTAAVAGTTAQ